MRSDQSSQCFRVGHCHVKPAGIDNKYSEKRKGAKVTILTDACIKQKTKRKQRTKQQTTKHG